MTEDAFWGGPDLRNTARSSIGEGQLIFFYKRTNRPITFSRGKFDHKGQTHPAGSRQRKCDLTDGNT